MTKNILTRKNGFSLAEIAVGLLVFTILAGIVAPNYVYSLKQEATKKTALEVSQIQEAARKYYIDNNAWPADIAALKTGGYLDSAWTATNPFSKAYSISSSAAQLSVSVDVPTEMTSVLQNNLPMATVTGVTVKSTVPVPGGSATGVPTGGIMPLGTTTIPGGWLLCNGQAVNRVDYAAIFSVIGTTFGSGNGSTTFNVPDLRGRTVVGLDNMGGTSANVLTAAWADNMGGSGGEEKHTQTVAEMPSHRHSQTTGDHDGPANDHFDAGSGNGPYAGSVVNVDYTGGGQAFNVVQPSTATNWIIKT